jgi:molecular chaperone GrpE (heat shock protein)
MRGGFDLYGNYYPNKNDALRAEMEQVSADFELSYRRQQSEEKEEIKYKIEVLQMAVMELLPEIRRQHYESLLRAVIPKAEGGKG